MDRIIRVKYIGNYYKVSLIYGKVYEVMKIEGGAYRIVDETGEDYLYPSNMFEIVKE